MLNTNCYDRVNSSIYVLTRGKCILSPCFFKRVYTYILIYIEIYHHNGVKRVSRVITNSYMRSCVRKKKMYWCVVLIFNLCFCLLKGRRV